MLTMLTAKAEAAFGVQSNMNAAQRVCGEGGVGVGCGVWKGAVMSYIKMNGVNSVPCQRVNLTPGLTSVAVQEPKV